MTSMLTPLPSFVCFNSNCRKPLEQPRNGWRLRSGEFAQLCDSCASVHDDGKFCETFHLNASGWRCCETCGKQIHCGCIVSFHMFVLLDNCGIECHPCARKNVLRVPAPNYVWSAPALTADPPELERLKDHLWAPATGSISGAWRKSFNGSSVKSDLNIVDNKIVTLIEGKKSEETPCERFFSIAMKNQESNILENGNNGANLELAIVSPSKNGKNSNVETNGKAQVRNNVFAPHLPQITTDQDLQRITAENYVITPLFEKTLTASDAGPMGRLILPKRSAEAYLPPISHPEGLPLKIQDLKGIEHVTQFRFWPNNNSRMYVLEGVTPCLQSMKLQAGDLVTFSRIEPEGKLIMGGRKAAIPRPSVQGNENTPGEGVSGKGKARTKSVKQEKSNWTSVTTTEGVSAAKPLGTRAKRKTKCPKTEDVNSTELKINTKLAQGVFRVPQHTVRQITVIEDCEIEAFEDSPVIGRPVIPGNNNLGEKIQWVQCEVCFKWRKLPSDALLTLKWTCSANLWDPHRSVCSAEQELTAEQLVDLLPTLNNAAFKKVRAAKQNIEMGESLEGLDALANLAIQEEGSSSQATTTRHPRHKPGCSCIVCMQRPSGKGPKHKLGCDCITCESLKRRHKTLLIKREKKLLEENDHDIEAAFNPTVGSKSPVQSSGGGLFNHSPNQKLTLSPECGGSVETRKPPLSPFKPGIDLNMQPKRDEELLPPPPPPLPSAPPSPTPPPPSSPPTAEDLNENGGGETRDTMMVSES